MNAEQRQAAALDEYLVHLRSLPNIVTAELSHVDEAGVAHILVTEYREFKFGEITLTSET